MNVLDLCSGIGGMSLGLERAGMRTVAFCERDEWCRAVLRKHWPDVPCFNDIQAIDADGLGGLGRIDLVCGGIPCQPFSSAGKQEGQADDRYLWPAMREIVALCRPSWVIVENVTGIIPLALDDLLLDLESLKYATRPFVIPACAVGARHRRDRLWLIAHTERSEQSRQEPCHGASRRMGRQQQPVAWDRDWQSALREFRGMDDGLSTRVERLDSIRNAIVPQIVEEIGLAIMSANTSNCSTTER